MENVIENAIVLYTCDEWRTYSSSRIVGIFNDEYKLKETICELFKDSKIEWDKEDIKALRCSAKEEYNYIEKYEDCDEDEIIEDIFESSRDRILKQIMKTDIGEIEDHADYIMIEEFIVNKASY